MGSTLDVVGSADLQNALSVAGPSTLTKVTGTAASFSSATVGGALSLPPSETLVRGRSSSETTVSPTEGDLLVKNFIQTGGELRIGEGYYASFKKNPLMAQVTEYVLPSSYPTASGQVLSSSTTGEMEWVTSSGGSGPNQDYGFVSDPAYTDICRAPAGALQISDFDYGFI